MDESCSIQAPSSCSIKKTRRPKSPRKSLTLRGHLKGNQSSFLNSTTSFGVQSKISHSLSNVSRVMFLFFLSESRVLLSIPELISLYWLIPFLFIVSQSHEQPHSGCQCKCLQSCLLPVNKLGSGQSIQPLELIWLGEEDWLQLPPVRKPQDILL